MTAFFVTWYLNIIITIWGLLITRLLNCSSHKNWGVLMKVKKLPLAKTWVIIYAFLFSGWMQQEPLRKTFIRGSNYCIYLRLKKPSHVKLSLCKELELIKLTKTFLPLNALVSWFQLVSTRIECWENTLEIKNRKK